MRANQFIPEAAIGTHPKRPSREGSRPERGHEPQKRYVTDRKTGKQYDPEEEFDKLKNSPEFQSQMKRMATKEGVAETLPMSDAVKVLKHHGAEHFKTTSNELHFYKNGRGLSVNLVMNSDATRSVTLSSLNSATRRLKGQGVAEGTDERKQNALWAQITAHEKAAKASKDLKRQHHLKMADQLRSQLKTSDNEQGVAEGAPIVVMPRADRLKKPEPTKVRYQGDIVPLTKPLSTEKRGVKGRPGQRPMPEQGVAEGSLEESIDAILTDLEEHGPTNKKLCLSSVSDKALGASALASCKSQGLRARDGKKSHLIGHGDSKVRVVVGGKKIKGKAHGGPLPDYGTRKGQ